MVNEKERIIILEEGISYIDEKLKNARIELFADKIFNAIMTNRYISEIADKYRIRHHSDMLKDYELHYSSQGWIDLYNYLLENGEMKFMEV